MKPRHSKSFTVLVYIHHKCIYIFDRKLKRNIQKKATTEMFTVGSINSNVRKSFKEIQRDRTRIDALYFEGYQYKVQNVRKYFFLALHRLFDYVEYFC